MLKIGIVVYEGFDELDAIGPYEVLRNAATRAAVDVRLVTLHRAATVRSGHGLSIVPDGTLDEPFDWLVVSGGSWATKKSVGAWGEIERGDLPRALAMWRERGTAMASVCTGAMLLSAAGITRGRRAVTHHVALEALQNEGAVVVHARVVDDGDLVTAGGVTSGIDLALWLVQRHFGKELAEGIARNMEYTRVGPISLNQ
jgi:transcriptional regulator GlxA family with amidase domain